MRSSIVREQKVSCGRGVRNTNKGGKEKKINSNVGKTGGKRLNAVAVKMGGANKKASGKGLTE